MSSESKYYEKYIYAVFFLDTNVSLCYHNLFGDLTYCPPAAREQCLKSMLYFIPGSDLLGVLLFFVDSRVLKIFLLWNIFAKYVLNNFWVIVFNVDFEMKLKARRNSCFGLVVVNNSGLTADSLLWCKV